MWEFGRPLCQHWHWHLATGGHPDRAEVICFSFLFLPPHHSKAGSHTWLHARLPNMPPPASEICSTCPQPPQGPLIWRNQVPTAAGAVCLGQEPATACSGWRANPSTGLFKLLLSATTKGTSREEVASTTEGDLGKAISFCHQ